MLAQDEYLKPLKSGVKKKGIVIYDIESKKDETQGKGFTRPFLVAFYDGKKAITWRNKPGMEGVHWKHRHMERGGCIDQFMRFILETHLPFHSPRRFQNKRINIYAHNGGKFDHLFIIGWLVDHKDKYQFEITSAQSRIQRLDVWRRGKSRKKYGSWSFLDSVSLLPMQLEKVGPTFNLAKGKIKMDLDTPEDHPDWEPYNIQDCKVLYRGLKKFQKLIHHLGGEVGITAPATAMKLFRRRYQKKWIHRNAHFADCKDECKSLDESNPEAYAKPCERWQCDGTCHGCAHDFVRQGYYGGRTELFRSYGYNLVYHDLNSSYPASMLEPMPVGKMFKYEGGNTRQLKLLSKDHIGFVECEVYIPKSKCKLPPLPFRWNGKLIFPVGRFTSVWDYDELKLLDHPLVNGKITKIIRSVWYQKAPVFREMVNDLYVYRQKHYKDCTGKDELTGKDCKGCRTEYNEGLSFCAKLMLNSLYGKFGMREDRTSLMLIPEGAEWPEHGWPTNGERDCRIWEVERIAKAPYIIPQISAHITALSRIKLFMGMAAILKRKGWLAYADTDSILSDKPPDNVGGKLGQWKNEYPGIMLEGEFILPKLYRLLKHDPGCTNGECEGCRGTVQRMKGVAGYVQTSENFTKMVAGESIPFDRLMQHRTMLNGEKLTPIVVTTSKQIRTKYDKRILLPNGTTQPLYVVDGLMP